MASITEEKNGRRVVQFVARDGKRRSVRLGKVTIKVAKEVKGRIEAINAAAIARVSIDNETAEWLGDIDDVLYEKLVAVGLCVARQPVESKLVAVLRPFLDGYIKLRSDVKQSTARHLREARDKLVAYFGAEKTLADVTPFAAEAYRLHLRKNLGENTVRRMVSRARQFFAAALRDRLIAENPFGHLKGLNVHSVKERQAFIDREGHVQAAGRCTRCRVAGHHCSGPVWWRSRAERIAALALVRS